MTESVKAERKKSRLNTKPFDLTQTLSEHFIRYSAAVAYPLNLKCCVFKDALLHTTVIIRGYLCYCHF